MKSKYWIVVLIALIVFSAIASIPLFLPAKDAVWAEVRSGGELNRLVNLNSDQEFVVPCSGGYNTITVRNGKIAVTEASCPDQYCVRQGYCNSGRAIVCLPHGLVISFLGDTDIDGALG